MSKFSLEKRASPEPSGAKGGILVASSSTVNEWLPVGTNGYVLAADSTTSTGLSYKPVGTGPGSLVLLKETVFAGVTPTGYSNGSTYTIDGSGYTMSFSGTNSAIDMVAAGLRLRRGTTAGTYTLAAILAGNTGDFASIVGEARFRRGGWAFWARTASWDFTNTPNAFSTLSSGVSGTYPKWGFEQRHRVRNLNGAPSTNVGGLAWDYWFNGTDVNPSSYPGVTTPDVVMTYARDQFHFDIYYGTYSGDWPTMETMTFMGTVSPAAGFIGQGLGTMTAAIVAINFQAGNSNATANTYEVVFDRWRLTTWE